MCFRDMRGPPPTALDIEAETEAPRLASVDEGKERSVAVPEKRERRSREGRKSKDGKGEGEGELGDSYA